VFGNTNNVILADAQKVVNPQNLVLFETKPSYFVADMTIFSARGRRRSPQSRRPRQLTSRSPAGGLAAGDAVQLDPGASRHQSTMDEHLARFKPVKFSRDSPPPASSIRSLMSELNCWFDTLPRPSL
jgi:hypothetical protein